MKKTLFAVLASVLICCSIVGTTYAWLVMKTEPITDTFTVGNINITLSESTSRNKKMVPGATLTENPMVTVKANSEDCWLFIRMNKSEGFETFLECSVANGWTALTGEAGIYYREVALNSEADQVFDILKDNQVTVKESATKEQYDELGEEDYPTLTFTAYAVQKLGFETPSAAWAEAKTLG